jgi:ferredoxin
MTVDFSDFCVIMMLCYKYIGGFTMAYKITDACISCGSCADQCPAEAISQGDTQYEINPDACLSCGACAEQCPMSAIIEE